ncbi:MAG: CRISPR-associated endonuclease Cas4g/Cas1g [Myxococcales bacterium]|jgi:CRISPR-associated protein Cas1
MDKADLLPARLLNEWAYCPRLAMLEHLHGEWAPNAFTEDGAFVHRRVDEERGQWPRPGDLEGSEVARSLLLSAPDEGLIARLDLVEAVGQGGSVRPVDYKRGEAPDLPEGAYEPERVQLAAQALCLRANGYRVDEGAIWFAGSRRRVVVPITDALVERTRQVVRELRAAIESARLPPPLVDSPRCNGCSLAPICLPDELGLLAEGIDEQVELDERLERRLVPARDDGQPLHVLTQGARIGLSGAELVVKLKDEELGRASLPKTSQVSLFGNVQVTTQAMRALLQAGTPVAFFSQAGWFYGSAQGMPHGNVFLRRAQYNAIADPEKALAIVRRLVLAKLRNQRTLVRRNAADPQAALARIDGAGIAAKSAPDIDTLRGHEGEGAAAYFSAFATMLKPPDKLAGFDFHGRNRRPPTDPVNAALSFGYSILCREWATVLATVGLDPLAGFLHQPRHGRPALALDLMEEFRPIIVDSVVIGAINTGELSASEFVTRGNACNLNDVGRRKFLQAWERRLDTLVTHPVFGYRISYRRTFEVQARLFGRYLLGEIDEYPAFVVR